MVVHRTAFLSISRPKQVGNNSILELKGRTEKTNRLTSTCFTLLK